MMMSRDAIAFALIYFTFFLDNVLLTALVPIVPELLGDDEELDWSITTNGTSISDEFVRSGGGSSAWAGLVLGAKAGAQLVLAPLAGAATRRRGPRAVLRAATATLAAAAAALCVCVWLGADGAAGAGRAALRVALVAARAAQGAGAAAAGVAGLAAAARGEGAVGALLGAVALGVLVGYPLGGAAYALWSRAAPFQLAAAALLLDLALQCLFLGSDKDELSQVGSKETYAQWSQTAPRSSVGAGGNGGVGGYRAALKAARRPPAAAAAGAVLLTTCVMAALEPCLPVWLMHRFHPQRWARGAVFVPDSVGYLAATTLLGGGGGRCGWAPERVALAGQVLVGTAALLLPLAPAAAWLAAPHAALGAGLGAADAALVPALLAARPHRVTQLAALLQAASSAAYALGPALGALLAGRLGFAALFRLLGAANLLYAAWLARHLAAHPLSPQWGAPPPAATPSGDSDSDTDEEMTLQPTTVHAYAALR